MLQSVCYNSSFCNSLFELYGLNIISREKGERENGMKTDILYLELQKQYEKMRQSELLLTVEEKKARHQIFAKTADEIIQMSNIGRRKGLAGLEEAGQNLPDDKILMKKMVQYVADGTEQDLLMKMILAKYFSMEQDSYQAICNLITIVGMCAVQDGLNPRIVREMIENMMPEDSIG